MLEKGALFAAKRLIGYRFYVREHDGSLSGGVIVETEAYTAEDAASHSFRGETLRNNVMFRGAGYIYVYFTYGMHWCVNIVTGGEGAGEAVLIRAIRPDTGLQTMRYRRGKKPDSELTNGPAKLCQALGIDGKDNGSRVGEGRFILMPPAKKPDYKVKATPRIGVRRDSHRLWRFIADVY